MNLFSFFRAQEPPPLQISPEEQAMNDRFAELEAKKSETSDQLRQVEGDNRNQVEAIRAVSRRAQLVSAVNEQRRRNRE